MSLRLCSFVVVLVSPVCFAQVALTVHVADGSGAAVVGAQVVLRCGGATEHEAAVTDGSGAVPLQRAAEGCLAEITAPGFLAVSSGIPLGETDLRVVLRPASSASVTVAAGESALLTQTPTAQHTLSAEQIAQIPMANASVGFTDLLTRTTPGVAADSNGFAHPLGEHADTSLSLDGQPIPDQQAKVFANQLDPAVIASMTVTTGAPPAEFGDKTSLVVDVTTRSGLERPRSGTYAAEYGSFGTWTQHVTVGGGGAHWGSFLAAGVSGSGRFLDTPEFRPLHARGNGETAFHRLDWRPRERDQLRLTTMAGRSWFQTPNSYSTQAAGQDQRSQIRNANVSMGWTHTLSPRLVTLVVPFYRHDEAQYFPSANPLQDATATLAQNRTLTHVGVRADGTFSTAHHTVKAGGSYWHTLLHERFNVGLTDPLFNAVCVDAAGDPVAAAGVLTGAACGAVGAVANPGFQASLLPYDLSRGGQIFRFDESADIEQAALFAQTESSVGPWTLTTGLRYDIYNGLSRGRQVQPRAGVSYKVLRSTVLRLSYARLYQTPYNENLIFASDHAGSNPFASNRSGAVRPGTRNQFNAGFEQAFGNHLTVSADYYWKFTRGDFDFDTLFNTPITFSVAWRKSKIDGLALGVHWNDFHGVSAYSVMGHVRSRFFTPQVGGVVFNSTPDVPVFRIDHGEEFEHTTNVRYQVPHLGKQRVSAAVTWRYNSGLALPDTVPTYLDALQLTANEQSQMGLHCGADYATPTRAIRSCSEAQFGATRIRIPRYGTEDEDRNPVRVRPRNLVDLQVADDRLFTVERVSVGVHASVLNATNRVALYNFLSTFSGTHFVPPRTLQIGVTAVF